VLSKEISLYFDFKRIKRIMVLLISNLIDQSNTGGVVSVNVQVILSEEDSNYIYVQVGLHSSSLRQR
jgi:signal transduction histidine kinase